MAIQESTNSALVLAYEHTVTQNKKNTNAIYLNNVVKNNAGRFVRYEDIHDKAEPEMPESVESLSRRISCETVSKAADRSRSTRKTHFPLSMASKISFCTFTTAVSVECHVRYPD